MSGNRFGPYELGELIGRGGMGEVYRAYDTRRDRVVALKRLSADVAHDPAYHARFRRESGMVARLREPHVIPIHDFGEIDGRLYIDMRLVEGTDLGTLIRRNGPLEPAPAVDILGQVARALDAAHRDDLVHRDVKPSNVLIDHEGGDPFVYLIDFGIARHTTGGTQLTGTGSAVGTTAYMSPERFEGHGDHRADIYALGCVLYEMLTGSPPFPGELLTQMYAHLHTPPPRASVQRPGVPSALDEVVARAMAKNPDHRYAKAGELATAARAALTAAPAAPPTRQPTVPTVQWPQHQPPRLPPQQPPHQPPHQPPPYQHPPTFVGGPPPQPAPRGRQWVVPVVAAAVVAAIVVVVVVVIATQNTGGTTGTGAGGTAGGTVAASPTTTVPIGPTGAPSATGTPATGGQPWRDPQGRFTLTPPQGWEIDDSGQQGTLVLFFAPDAAYAPEGPFRVNVNVVTGRAAGTFDDMLSGARVELSRFPDYVSTTDEEVQLGDGTRAHLLGCTFTDSASGFHLQNEQLFAVSNGTLIVVTGTAPVNVWADYGPELDSILRTLDVSAP